MTPRRQRTDWNSVFGEHGQFLKEAVAEYDYRAMFSDLVALCSIEMIGVGGGTIMPLWYVYGDLAGSNEAADASLQHARPLMGGTIPEESANTVGNL